MMENKFDLMSGQRICPRCGYENAHYDINFETLEESMVCLKCGFVREIRAVVETGDEETPEKVFKRSEDGNLVYEVHEVRSAGAFGILYEKGGRRSSLHTVPSEEEIQDFKKHLEETGAKAGYMGLWNDETKTVQTVVGELYFSTSL